MATIKRRTYDVPHLRRSGPEPAARVAEPVPHCWFCDATSGRTTREHLFPSWVRAEHASGMFHPFRVVPTAALAGLNPIEDTRKKDIDIDNLVAGKVCMRCNNGWMSRLESEAKPLLVESERRTPLSPVEAETLAWWFAKTAAVVNVSQPYRLLWPSERRHGLADRDLGHVLVTLARADRPDANYVQANPGSVAYLGEEPSKSALRSIALTHQCSIQVGTLVGTVLALPPEIQSVPVQSRRTLLYDRGISHAVSLRSVARVKDIMEAFTNAFTPRLTPSAFFVR